MTASSSSAAPSAPPLLRAENVSVTLGRRMVVQHASLDGARGAVTVLMGPNGAGKTTLIRALAGLVAATGRITLDGQPLAALTPAHRAKRIAYLPQGHEFRWPLTAAQIVALGRMPHGDAFTGLSAADHAAIARAIAATEIETLAARTVTTLSGGERARVAIARALATEADGLIADEPVAALDARHQLLVMELLRAVARRGQAVICVLHDLSLAMRYADRVVLMKDGRIATQGDPRDVLTPQHIADVFGIVATSVGDGETTALVPLRPL